MSCQVLGQVAQTHNTRAAQPQSSGGAEGQGKDLCGGPGHGLQPKEAGRDPPGGQLG